MINVGTISLVGITIVFFTFVVLFFLFKLLAKMFGEKETKKVPLTEFNTSKKKKHSSEHSNEKSTDEPELIAVITAAISSYSEKEFRILNFTERKRTTHDWRKHKSKIWRPARKGVKKTW